MIRKLRPLLFCLCFALALLPLRGSVQAQPDLGAIVRIDVLDGGQQSDGTHLAALRLTLADGWKTYWRAPGDAGIPPSFRFARSGNMASAAPVWPTPEVFDLNGIRTIGYRHQLVLPLVIQPRSPGQPVRLRGEIDFGVCSDVCIPARLNFDGALDPAAPRNPAIAAALAARPYSATEAGVPPARCRVAPTGDGLAVTVRMTMPSAGTPETVVIEPPAPDLWASETETTRAGGVLTARAELSRADGKPFALDRSGLRITVLGTRRAVDIRGCTAE